MLASVQGTQLMYAIEMASKSWSLCWGDSSGDRPFGPGRCGWVIPHLNWCRTRPLSSERTGQSQSTRLLVYTRSWESCMRESIVHAHLRKPWTICLLWEFKGCHSSRADRGHSSRLSLPGRASSHASWGKWNCLTLKKSICFNDLVNGVGHDLMVTGFFNGLESRATKSISRNSALRFVSACSLHWLPFLSVPYGDNRGSPWNLAYLLDNDIVFGLTVISSVHIHLLLIVSETSAPLLEPRFSQFISSQNERYFRLLNL
jgi:hypothetical protein